MAEKTSLGISENVEALLCYVLGWITGIVFLIAEKENRTIKFHALQSIFTFGGLTLVIFVLGFIPIVGWAVGILLSLLSFVLWIMAMIMAYQGKKFKFPIAGDMAEKNI